jgi:hypothetical protein
MDATGRGAHGHFAKGHTFSRNNRKSLRLRWAMLRHVTDQDVIDIIKALLEKAKAGDVKAAKEVLDRVCGKATLPIEVVDDRGTDIAELAQKLKEWRSGKG